MSIETIGRRQFLLGAGGFSLALPLLPSLHQRAARAGDYPYASNPRFVAFATSHGGIWGPNMYPGDETLFGRRVGQIHCGLYATREYLAAFGEPEILSQLRQHRIVGSEGAVEKLPQCAVLRDAVANARCDFCADNTNVQLAAVRAGFGIAALPCLITRHEPTLKRVLAHSFDVPVDLWVLVNRNLKGTGPVRETYDFILREAVKDANLLKGAA